MTCPRCALLEIVVARAVKLDASIAPDEMTDEQCEASAAFRRALGQLNMDLLEALERREG